MSVLLRRVNEKSSDVLVAVKARCIKCVATQPETESAKVELLALRSSQPKIIQLPLMSVQ